MIKTYEIYLRDLTKEARIELLKEFQTTESDENWDIIPLAVIEREIELDPGGMKTMDVDRVENWRRFSEHMEEYIRERTVKKYEIDTTGGFDLMSITRSPIICVWHVLKYSLRMWNNSGKAHDLEKMAHYAEMAWTMADGKGVRNEGVEGIVKS
jgi:phage pi2 protein 07